MTGQYIEDRFDTSASADGGIDNYPKNPVIDPEPLMDDEQEVGGPYSDMPITEAAEVEEVEETIPEFRAEEYLSSQPLANVEPSGELPIINPPADAGLTHEVVYSPVVESPSTALLNREDSERFRNQWKDIQGKFVDEPRSAVQQADALVSEVMDQITKMFTSEHGALEIQWKQGADVSTENLRKALQHYRAFFNRLVV